MAAVALLLSCGLVEDGDVTPGSRRPEPVGEATDLLRPVLPSVPEMPMALSGMLGSGLSRTLALPSRQAAWQVVANTQVWLGGVGQPGDDGIMSRLHDELGSLVCLRQQPQGCTMGIFVHENAEEFDYQLLDRLIAGGMDVLMVEHGRELSALGPLLTRMAGPTARCHAQDRDNAGVRAKNRAGYPIRKNLDDLDQQALDQHNTDQQANQAGAQPGSGSGHGRHTTRQSRDLASTVLVSLVSHHMVAMLARGVAKPLVGMVVEIDANGATRAHCGVDVRHVRDRNGLPLPVGEHIWRNPAWRHHTRIQDLPARFRPVRGYDVHFSPAVLALTRAGRPLPGGTRHLFSQRVGGDLALVLGLAMGINKATGRPYTLREVVCDRLSCLSTSIARSAAYLWAPTSTTRSACAWWPQVEIRPVHSIPPTVTKAATAIGPGSQPWWLWAQLRLWRKNMGPSRLTLPASMLEY